MPVRVPGVGQLYRAGERLSARDHWLATLAYLMDGSIPLGKYRIGLDPALGLDPGSGICSGRSSLW